MSSGLKSALMKLEAGLVREGQAPMALHPHIVPGAVFVAEDQQIRFPGRGRTMHEERWVILISPPAVCASLTEPKVEIVPCTSQVDPRDGDVAIPASEPGFNKDSLALVRFRQHIFKAALRTFRGMLSPTLLARVLGEVARHPGL